MRCQSIHLCLFSTPLLQGKFTFNTISIKIRILNPCPPHIPWGPLWTPIESKILGPRDRDERHHSHPQDTHSCWDGVIGTQPNIVQSDVCPKRRVNQESWEDWRNSSLIFMEM